MAKQLKNNVRIVYVIVLSILVFLMHDYLCSVLKVIHIS